MEETIMKSAIAGALNCTNEEFTEKYNAYKKAKLEFEEILEPVKDVIIGIHQNTPDLPGTFVVGGVKLTYVAPSVRSTIDSKKLKEEEPELAKKFTKTTRVSASVRVDGI